LNLFSTVSYLSLAALYAVLTFLLLTSWQRNRTGALLIVACGVSVAWAVVLGMQAAGKPVSDVRLIVFESLRNGAWLVFLLALFHRARYFALLAALAASTWAVHLVTSFLSLSSASLGGVAVAICGLFLVEMLFRNTPDESRGRIIALVVGIGGIFAYDLILHSQAIALGVYDSTTWSARAAANVLFVPFIAVMARRTPQAKFEIFVSRHVVFYSASVISVAVYLALMIIGSRLLVTYGGTWGELARVVFVTAAAIALILLLVSEKLRGSLRVWLNKHFFRNKYDYREEWLRLIATVAEVQDRSTREVVVRSIGQLVGSPGGWLWLLSDDGRSYELALAHNVENSLPSLDANGELVRFIKADGWLVDLEEYETNRPMYGKLELPNWLKDRDDAWLIVPLMFQQQLLGLVMLAKGPVLFELNFEDRDLLKTVGNHLAVHLAQAHSDRLLTEARQFDAYNRLTAFLMHDLNNLIAQQSLIVENAKKHGRNPEFVDDAMRTIENSVERMRRVMERLKRRSESGVSRSTNIQEAIAAAIDACSEGVPKPTPEIRISGVVLSIDGEQLSTVLSHLIKNAQDATPAEGEVRVSVGGDDNEIVIEVADTGAGMSREFIRERLFQPFDSTKGSRGMGIGAYQAREFARSNGGELLVDSEEGVGTIVRLVLPVM
jgi:putative PEP-CTERM system histidine kinase